MALKTILGTAAVIATLGSAALAQQITVVTHGQIGNSFWDVVRQGVLDGAAANRPTPTTWLRWPR